MLLASLCSRAARQSIRRSAGMILLSSQESERSC
jgi:hypothetical protein